VNSLIRVAHAFTCFQLTELVRRVPKTLEKFSADVLIITALPDLYFDEDIRDREARASFEHALEGLGNLARLSLSIAVFSDATSFKTKRRDFFQRLRNQADHVVKVESTPENKLSFTREKNTPLLPASTEGSRHIMGRTVPTFVQLIQQAAERWKKFRRALRRKDQPHFDRLFVRVRCYTQAAICGVFLTLSGRKCVQQKKKLPTRSGARERSSKPQPQGLTTSIARLLSTARRWALRKSENLLRVLSATSKATIRWASQRPSHTRAL
jgi:hypothetical protein